MISSAFATGFLPVPLILSITRRFLDACLLVMICQALVGLIGFWFHMRANLVEPEQSIFDKLINGAPPMAPPLFPNLVALALIGLWFLIPHVPEAEHGRSWLGRIYDWAHRDEHGLANDWVQYQADADSAGVVCLAAGRCGGNANLGRIPAGDSV